MTCKDCIHFQPTSIMEVDIKPYIGKGYTLQEILKISEKVKLEGYTLIPLKVYFKDNKAKLLLGLCKGKKVYDKRETIKERDIKRDLEKKYKN